MHLPTLLRHSKPTRPADEKASRTPEKTISASAFLADFDAELRNRELDPALPDLVRFRTEVAAQGFILASIAESYLGDYLNPAFGTFEQGGAIVIPENDFNLGLYSPMTKARLLLADRGRPLDLVDRIAWDQRGICLYAHQRIWLIYEGASIHIADPGNRYENGLRFIEELFGVVISLDRVYAGTGLTESVKLVKVSGSWTAPIK